MSKTYLDYFNHTLNQFLNELISYFPFTKEGVLNNYRGLLEGKDRKSDLYVKYYMSKVNDKLKEIATRDPHLFEKEHLYLLEGVNFNIVWNSPESNATNKNAIWKYLQLLALLGRNIIPNEEYILKMLNKVGGTIETPEKLDKTLNKEDTDIDATDGGEDEGIMGMLNMAGKVGNMFSGKGGSGGGLEDIAGNLGNLGNINDMLGDLGNIGEMVSETMKNFNFEEMAKNMKEEMDNINQTDEDEETVINETEQGTSEEETTKTSNNNNNSSSGSTSNLIADMAKEMGQTFDLNSNAEPPLTSDGKPDIGKAFQNMMSGDNPKKIMKMVSKFSAKIQKDITNGRMNEQDLLRQTSEMMGGADVGKMAEEMMKNPKMKNKYETSMRNQNARDRLRKKLENRKNNNENNN